MWAYGSDELKPTSKNIKANEGGKQIIYLIGRAEMITFLVSVFPFFVSHRIRQMGEYLFGRVLFLY